MKRRTKTKQPARNAVSAAGREKNCQSLELKGHSKATMILAAAGVFVVFFAGTLVVTQKGFHWMGKGKEGKFGKINKIETTENLQSQISALQKQINELKKGNSAVAPADQNQAAANQTSSAFEKAVNDKDFSKVETLMAAKVFYVVDASDCCGDITRKEAVEHLQNYIRNVKSFDFDQEQQVVRQMKVNLAGTFAKYTIGIADNKMVLSYHLNKQGKVDDVMLSASHLMYDLE